MNCRHCHAALEQVLLDLGAAPPSNGYLTSDRLRAAEKWYPLRVFVCSNCWLVQTEDYADRQEFFSDDYAYFSSFSKTWVAHAREYVNKVIVRFQLSDQSLVSEVAANDGYLLQFVQAHGIPCYGIEPTASTASAARAKGIEIVGAFFGVNLAVSLASAQRQCDLIVANNVLGHVPDLNDFTQAFAYLLKPDGVATFEFPHLLRLLEESQFDTVYHEHYSYLSFTVVRDILRKSGLGIFDVEELSTHGGSLRVYAQRADTGRRPVLPAVTAMLDREASAGICTAAYYTGFQKRANRIKNELLAFLVRASQKNSKVAAYGAAAKGNTLLNYAGVRRDLLPYVVDSNPAKQGKYLPGSRIPIVAEDKLREDRPEFVLILPWNIKNEIMEQLSYIRAWGGSFVIAAPTLQIV
jgi:SAM-dependent methyltransferase